MTVLVRLAFQNLLRSPGSTLMLVLVVAVCTAAAFCAVVVGRGIDDATNRASVNSRRDLTCVPSQPNTFIDPKIAKQIASIDGIEAVSGHVLCLRDVPAPPRMSRQLRRLGNRTDAARFSSIVVHLARTGSAEQVRNQIGQISDLKLTSNGDGASSAPPLLSRIFPISIIFAGLFFVLAALFMLSSLSMITEKRHGELGALAAMGTNSTQLTIMLLVEGAITACSGGMLGVVSAGAFILALQRSLAHFLESMDIQYVLPRLNDLILFAAVCVAAAIALGTIGAFFPACRTLTKEPSTLIMDSAA